MANIFQSLSCIFLSYPLFYVSNVRLVSYKFLVFRYKADISVLVKFQLLFSAPFPRLPYYFFPIWCRNRRPVIKTRPNHRRIKVGSVRYLNCMYGLILAKICKGQFFLKAHTHTKVQCLILEFLFPLESCCYCNHEYIYKIYLQVSQSRASSTYCKVLSSSTVKIRR